MSCVTRQLLDVSAPAGSAAGRDVTIAFPDPVSLRAPQGGPSGLFFDCVHRFTTVAKDDTPARRWRVSTRMYQYRLMDYHHEELLVYHWQPGADFEGPDYPHVHVSAALDAQVDAQHSRPIELDKLHVATGRVSLEAVVRMLITEFNVGPLRQNWRETLDRTERVFSGRVDPAGVTT